MTTQLPNPRRIITAHKADGSAQVHDDTIQPTNLGGGFSVSQAFVQDQFVVEPVSAFDGWKVPFPGFFQPGGVTARWVDIDAKVINGFAHYTDTLDYVVIIHGELEFLLHDGTKKVVRPGDLVVQLANVHQWNNLTDQPARFFVITLPSKPVLVNGKTLEEEPINGHKAG